MLGVEWIVPKQIVIFLWNIIITYTFSELPLEVYPFYYNTIVESTINTKWIYEDRIESSIWLSCLKNRSRNVYYTDDGNNNRKLIDTDRDWCYSSFLSHHTTQPPRSRASTSGSTTEPGRLKIRHVVINFGATRASGCRHTGKTTDQPSSSPLPLPLYNSNSTEH